MISNRGLILLIRVVPVAAWSLAGLAIGVCAALRTRQPVPTDYLDIALMVVSSVVVQGFLAHSVNDLTDWRSGTDARSPGVLSGGSRVIPLGLVRPRQLVVVASGSLVIALLVGAHFAASRGPAAWLVVGTGLWAALAYSLPPLSLSYRPLAGEWLAAWPAAFACVAGSFYLLTGGLRPGVTAAATLHASYSVAWLMQHHIPDVAADWMAVPRKSTTVAWVVHRFGPRSAPAVPALYFAGAALQALLFAWRLAEGPTFLPSALLAAAGVVAALRQKPGSIRSESRVELALIGLAITNALWLAIVLEP